jgi:hypothetical protein
VRRLTRLTIRGIFPSKIQALAWSSLPQQAERKRKTRRAGKRVPRGKRRSPLCRVSCTSLSPWVRPRVRYRKEKEKENTEKKRRKSKFLKKRLSNIREEKNKSFFFDLDENFQQNGKSVEFILKKENIPGQVFLSFFSIL